MLNKHLIRANDIGGYHGFESKYNGYLPALLGGAEVAGERLLVMQHRQSRRLAAMRRSLKTKRARNSTESTMKLAATHTVA